MQRIERENAEQRFTGLESEMREIRRQNNALREQVSSLVEKCNALVSENVKQGKRSATSDSSSPGLPSTELCPPDLAASEVGTHTVLETTKTPKASASQTRASPLLAGLCFGLISAVLENAKSTEV